MPRTGYKRSPETVAKCTHKPSPASQMSLTPFSKRSRSSAQYNLLREGRIDSLYASRCVYGFPISGATEVLR